MPEPPTPSGFGWLAAMGPGVIVLGLSIGSGEFLLGPAIFVKHGLTLLWVTLVAILLQTVFNTEVMRYTLATGEPVFTGFMRTRPSATAWAWFYAALYFLQVGWPAWAGAAHLLYINTRLLPRHVRPPVWRRAALVGMALFYGLFVSLAIYSLVVSKLA